MRAPAPLSVELPAAGRRVVVAGHGPRAATVAAALLDSGARVLVVTGATTDVTPSLADLAARGRIELRCHRCTPADLTGAWLVYPRHDDAAENARISADARAAHLWSIDAPPAEPPQNGTGMVTILGGGPGDPGLITVRGQQALAEADVVVHDRLAPLPLLADLPASTVLIDAAKVPGGRAMPQAQIHRHLIEQARLGRNVVRLKGGDPFVFGRGMEEVEACLAADVPVRVIPGVSSAVGVPGAAGISLTHRGLAHAFTVVSGHLAPESAQSTVDWATLARSGATLVLMMAVDTLPSITAALLAAGMDSLTPTATVQEGGTDRQVVLRSVLDRLAADAAGIRPPAVTVIGPVAAHGVDLTAQLDAVLPAVARDPA